MADEFDDAARSETIRVVVTARGPERAGDEASRVARLVTRLYAGMNPFNRSSLLMQLLRPLGPLGRAAVASGAFAGVFFSRGVGSTAIAAFDDLARFSNDQVFELARFVEQASPEALRRIASTIAAHPPGASALTAAAALLLMRLLQEREAAAPVEEAAPAMELRN